MYEYKAGDKVVYVSNEIVYVAEKDNNYREVKAGDVLTLKEPFGNDGRLFNAECEGKWCVVNVEGILPASLIGQNIEVGDEVMFLSLIDHSLKDYKREDSPTLKIGDKGIVRGLTEKSVFLEGSSVYWDKKCFIVTRKASKSFPEKWAIEVTEDNVQELLDAGFYNAKTALENQNILYSDNTHSATWYYEHYQNRQYPFIDIEQFREKYGKKEKSSIEKLKELGVKVSKADLSYLHNMKPVIYFLPEKTWIKDRVEEIETAIKEALTANLCIPTEWVTEYNKHIEWLKNN